MTITPTEEQMKIVNAVLELLCTKTVVVIHVCGKAGVGKSHIASLVASYVGGIISFEELMPVGVPVDSVCDTVLVQGGKQRVIIITDDDPPADHSPYHALFKLTKVFIE